MDEFQRLRHNRRFYRQIDRLDRHLPLSRRMIAILVAGRFALIRVPFAVLFILGGLVGFLPVVGFWMLPLGLVLLAVDLPILRAPTGAMAIRLRALLRRLRR